MEEGRSQSMRSLESGTRTHLAPSDLRSNMKHPPLEEVQVRRCFGALVWRC